MRIEIISLGCPKNLVDTENMLGLLAKAGHKVKSDGKSADVLLINTCAFIQAAREEAYQEIGRGIKAKAEGKYRYLIVAGCLPQLEKENLLRRFPQIDEIIGVPVSLATPKTPRILTTPSASAYLKIADGCNNCCTYCTVPTIRGRFKSKKLEDVITEATHLAQRGVKELILVAQDTTVYGIDLYDKPRLADLLKSLAKTEGIVWVRLMYAHPAHLQMEVVETMAQEEKICKYIDLPLQHASDRILKRMGRGAGRGSITNLIKKIRGVIPNLALRSSFMVGFPGETERDFEELKEFLTEIKFDKVGVFKYSREKNTSAARQRGQVPEDLKEQRFKESMVLQRKISRELNKKLIGTVLNVLVENRNYGRSFREAPEIDGSVYINHSRQVSSGKFVKVKINRADAYDLAGTVVT